MAFGRLERTKGSEPMYDINVTPMVDVMLVLVVIFILTAPLLASSIRLDLPKTDGAKPGDPPQFVTVAVDQAGQAFFNDKPVDAAELSVALQQAKLDNPDTEVQLRADQGVPYGRVVEVMGEAQKAGLNRIGFVAEAPAPAPGAAPPAAAGAPPAAGTAR
ncbi:MAG: biopolymer transporter ExbD [Burkholderiales bacterium]|uniref:ExbD/TolR family protein n=1 Tax=Ottowia sp. TaxID=1898956 RepID=UPI001AC66A32|nr:biopolymer transporter ExbD [Ottowia sp.]MBN9406729.1 biopolymer transporter ExbD [Burkholderiales bacterium]MBS0403064.1 biopolymer transporter ExbD [Pseudomonadota bacterium]